MAAGLSEYEQRRLRNLEENRRILGELGAVANPMPLPVGFRRPPPPRKAGGKQQTRAPLSMAKPKSGSSANRGTGKEESAADPDAALARRLAEADDAASRRRSSRLEGRPAPRYVNQCDGFGKDDSGEENWAPSRADDSDGGGECDEDEDSDGSGDDGGDGEGHRRRRRRRSGGPTAENQRPSVFDRPKVEKNRPNHYGSVPGVAVGTLFETRIDACLAGLHRPTVAGIHGGPDGAYSIALSGGYQDDIDLGSHFTYTGEGGRDLKGTKANPKNLRTAPQTRDQCLTRNNGALVRSAETGFPVRVIRGYKLRSEYAPSEGYYRYDGLYRVEKWWYTAGMSSFGVYKFAFKRLPDQETAPWEAESPATVYNFKTDYRPMPAGPSDGDDKEKAEDAQGDSSVAEESSAGSDGEHRPAKVKEPKKPPRKQKASKSQSLVEVDFQALLSGDGGEVPAADACVESSCGDSDSEPRGKGDSKGRRRSLKGTASSTSAEAVAVEAEAEAVADPGVKKRRGRPRKSQQPSASPADTKDESPPPPLDPPPPPPPAVEEAAATFQPDVPPPPAPRRKGGRPGRKSMAVEAAADAVASPPRKRSRFFFED